MTVAIAVTGTGSKSGKTTTVEALVRELSARGYNIGTIKQIEKTEFTIDTKGRDTWRHAEAGAKVVVSSAPREVALIKRLENGERFNEAMRLLERDDLDLILVEGNPPVELPRILTANDVKKAKELFDEVRGNIFCISTIEPEEFKKAGFGVPVFHPEKESALMVETLVKYLGTK